MYQLRNQKSKWECQHFNLFILFRKSQTIVDFLGIETLGIENQLTWDGLNVVFVILYIRDVLRILAGFTKTFPHIPVKMGNKVKKILSPLYSI